MRPFYPDVWRRLPRRKALWLVALVLAPLGGREALASAYGEVTLVRLEVPGGHNDPRPRGITTLLAETRRRTSIEVAQPCGTLNLGAPAGPTPLGVPRPMLWLWQGDAGFEPLPEAAIARLREGLQAGASLLIDASDGQADGPFLQSVRRELTRVLPDHPLTAVPHSHVLYKTFYLVDRHGGRTQARAGLDGITLEGRLAVVVVANDLFGALARTPQGAWEYTAQGGERSREMALRLGINWLMYALCLDYKEDQVHLPFILKRRR